MTRISDIPGVKNVFFFVYFTAYSLGFFYKIFSFNKKIYNSTRKIRGIRVQSSSSDPLEGVAPAVVTAASSSAVPAATAAAAVAAAVRSPTGVTVSLVAHISSILVSVTARTAAAAIAVSAFAPVSPTAAEARRIAAPPSQVTLCSYSLSPCNKTTLAIYGPKQKLLFHF